MTPKDLLEKARHCILQNFEQVQKKRGVGLIKNKHWRAQRASERSERASCARQCLFFMGTPLFFCTSSKFWRMQRARPNAIFRLFWDLGCFGHFLGFLLFGEARPTVFIHLFFVLHFLCTFWTGLLCQKPAHLFFS